MHICIDDIFSFFFFLNEIFSDHMVFSISHDKINKLSSTKEAAAASANMGKECEKSNTARIKHLNVF